MKTSHSNTDGPDQSRPEEDGFQHGGADCTSLKSKPALPTGGTRWLPAFGWLRCSCDRYWLRGDVAPGVAFAADLFPAVAGIAAAAATPRAMQTASKFDALWIRRAVLALGLAGFIFAAMRLLLLPIQL